jgi:hypothetical protein
MTLFLWFWLCGAVATWVGGRFYWLYMNDNPDKYDDFDCEAVVGVVVCGGLFFPATFVLVIFYSIGKLLGLLTQILYERFIKSN